MDVASDPSFSPAFFLRETLGLGRPPPGGTDGGGMTGAPPPAPPDTPG